MHVCELEAFVAICEQGSFSGAAHRLHLTQPAISKRIASLETALGHRLFDRVGRGASLTEAGRTYLDHARQVLMDLADGRQALDNLSAEVRGPLRLALSHHVALHRMPAVLRRYRQRYPQVSLEIEFLSSEAACQSIIGGRLELAIITLPPPHIHALDMRRVWSDPMRILVAPDHPLAALDAPAATDLAGFTALLPETDTYTYAVVEQALAAVGVALTPGRADNHLETLKMLANVGLGWTALPETMVDSGLVTLDIPGVTLQRDLGSVRHPRRSLSNAARALLDLLEQAPGRAPNHP